MFHLIPYTIAALFMVRGLATADPQLEVVLYLISVVFTLTGLFIYTVERIERRHAEQTRLLEEERRRRIYIQQMRQIGTHQDAA